MDAVRAAASVLVRTGPQVGCVLIVGGTPNFCTGGDVRAFAAAPDRRALLAEMAHDLHALVLGLAETPLPVVTGVSGWAAGAGMSIACVADVIVGGPDTRFRPAYPSIGYSPDGGMSWTLARSIGAARARDLLLTDSVLGGEEALRAGLLTRLVATEDVQHTAESVAAALADGPTETYARIKRLLAEAPARSLAEQLTAEAESIAESADSPAGRAGVDAFIRRHTSRSPRP